MAAKAVNEVTAATPATAITTVETADVAASTATKAQVTAAATFDEVQPGSRNTGGGGGRLSGSGATSREKATTKATKAEVAA